MQKAHILHSITLLKTTSTNPHSAIVSVFIFFVRHDFFFFDIALRVQLL
jgi:hypothetical protein